MMMKSLSLILIFASPKEQRLSYICIPLRRDESYLLRNQACFLAAKTPPLDRMCSDLRKRLAFGAEHPSPFVVTSNDCSPLIVATIH
jgi:hypothetical protein